VASEALQLEAARRRAIGLLIVPFNCVACVKFEVGPPYALLFYSVLTADTLRYDITVTFYFDPVTLIFDL